MAVLEAPPELQAQPAPRATIVLTAALVARQAAARDAITNPAMGVVGRLWRGFAEWYDEAAVLSIAFRSSKASVQAQARAAAMSSSATRQALALLSVPVAPATFTVPPQGLRGTDFLEEWSRPAETYRYERSVGTPDDLALERAVRRAERLVEDDVSLANREGARLSLERAGTRVTGYRRVIHPELSRSGVCGLCIVASDRLYTKTELLPVHGRCRCEVLPIVDDLDPGTPIETATLESLYAAAGSTYGPDLKKVRVRYDEHGELGPVLSPAGQPPRKGSESRGSGRPGGTDLDSRAAQIKQLSRTLPTLERLAAADAPGAREALAQRRARLAELGA